jgi:hypothetical protein
MIIPAASISTANHGDRGANFVDIGIAARSDVLHS